jgi:HlyD family secretion protein
MNPIYRKWLPWALVALLAAGGALAAWRHFRAPELPAGFAMGNGRIEATEIDIATKLPGRITEVLAREGDTVQAGQIVARMDTQALEAELRQAEAQLRQARDAKATAAAVVAQRVSELTFAENELKRSEQLAEKGFISAQKADSDRTRVLTAKAVVVAARSQLTEAQSAIEAAVATTERIKADIADSILKAPRGGRVQYRLAEPGEVLPAGGKLLSLLDLTDVYMTLFLSETLVGRVAIGAQARIVLDAAPQYVIPATVTYVAPEAQFTPKTVETATERQKLAFRVKAQIDPELLRKYEPQVKTGLPGLAYVRLDAKAQWPATLQVKLPQ